MLLLQSARLAHGDFVGSNGTHAVLLQGARGIGKTALLRAYTHVCETLYPSVVPIYITFNSLADRHSPLRPMGIMGVVAAQLRRRGIAIAPADGDFDDSIDDMLSLRVLKALAATAGSHGDQPVRVLLLVDDIDQLYRVAAVDALALRCLNDLAFVGASHTGLFSVVLCGKSPLCSQLMTRDATEDLRAAFPALSRAPRLNYQQYRVWHIASPLPTDVALVRDVMAARPCASALVDERAARLLAFASGGDVRKISAFASEAEMGNFVSDASNDWRTTGVVGSDGEQLYKDIMAKLRKKNAAVMASLCTDGALDRAKVAAVPWEREFQPLTWAEVEECWRHQEDALDNGFGRCMRALVGLTPKRLRAWILGADSDSGPAKAYSTVLDLCDAGYLTYGATAADGPSAGDSVYPAAVSHLF